MNKTLIAGMFGLAIGAATIGASAATVIPLDPHHTSATFTISHLTITKVSGQVPLLSSHMAINANGIPTEAQATFDLTKIETQDDHRDSDLKSDKWFDTAKFPKMVFHSTVITPGANNSFRMQGMLTMHGVSKPITLNGTYAGKAVAMGHTHLGYSATGTIDRTLWGVGNAPAAIVGNDVTITIEAEGIEN